MEIKINGEYIDTFDNVIALTRQFIDPSNLKNAFLGRSNQFTIPSTPRNNRILKHPRNINTNSNAFETTFDAVVLDKGIVLLKGVAIIEEAGENYSIQVVDSSKLMFDNLNVPMRWIDCEDSNFEWLTNDWTAFEAYKIENSSVWRWSADCQHVDLDSTKCPLVYPANLHWHRPQFNVWELITRCFEAQGWTIEDFTGSEKIKKAIILSNAKEFYLSSYQMTTSEAFTGYNLLSGFNTPDFYKSSVSYNSTSFNVGTDKCQVRIKGGVEVVGEWRIELQVDYGTTPDTEFQTFYLNSSQKFIDFTSEVIESDTTSARIQVLVAGSGSLTFNNLEIFSILKESEMGTLEYLTTSPLDEYYVKASENLPEMTQIDFIKEIFILFGVSLNVNQNNKKVIPYLINNDRTNAVDWSDKFILNSDTVTPGNLARYNSTSYSNDDFVNSSKGYAAFEIDSDLLSGEAEYITSKFSATDDVTMLLDVSGYPVPPIYLQNLRLPTCHIPIYNDQGRVNEVTNRVMLFDLPIKVGGVPIAPELWLLYACSTFKELVFNIINEDIYKLFIKALQSNRYIEASFNLNRSDFLGFEGSKIVYVRDLGGYFYVPSIDDFEVGKETTVNLLKIK